MQPVPSDEIPTGYSAVPASVFPKMGVHMIDMDAPEFKGKPFTYTWIYGIYDGKLSFLEPMATREFLEKHTNVNDVSIPTPAKMPEAGWYPTAYSIRHDDRIDVYYVTLESFRKFEASSGSNAQTSSSAGKRSADRIL
jgi:hypothetical protein